MRYSGWFCSTGHLPKTSDGADSDIRYIGVEPALRAAGEAPRQAAVTKAENVVDQQMAVEAEIAGEKQVLLRTP